MIQMCFFDIHKIDQKCRKLISQCENDPKFSKINLFFFCCMTNLPTIEIILISHYRVNSYL